MINDRQELRRAGSITKLERDAALARVRRTRRWLIAAAAGLSAAFAAIVSAIAPGRTVAAPRPLHSTASAPRFVPARTSNRMPPLESASALGLNAPNQAPQPAPDQSPGAPTPTAPGQSQAATPPPATPAPAPSAAPQNAGGGAVVSGGS